MLGIVLCVNCPFGFHHHPMRLSLRLLSGQVRMTPEHMPFKTMFCCVFLHIEPKPPSYSLGSNKTSWFLLYQACSSKPYEGSPLFCSGLNISHSVLSFSSPLIFPTQFILSASFWKRLLMAWYCLQKQQGNQNFLWTGGSDSSLQTMVGK